MSREILFRGFHVDSNGTEIAVVNGVEYKGEWVCGYVAMPVSCAVRGGKIENVEQYYFNAIISSVDDTVGLRECRVLADTVCEFTGLTDKNGKRIFEGDMLRLWVTARSAKGMILREYHKPLPVRYDNLWCQFVADDTDNKEQFGIWQEFEQIEVIGTIFDKEKA